MHELRSTSRPSGLSHLGRETGALFVVLVGLSAILACEGTPGGSPGARLEGRPPDGLLTDERLQDIVEMQEARDPEGVLAALSDSDPVVRARAAFAMASVQAPNAAPALVPLLDDPDPRVRADAVFALRQWAQGNPMLADAPSMGPGVALVRRLQVEDDPKIRAALMEAIGVTGSDRALRAYLETDLRPDEEAAFAVGLSRAMFQSDNIPEGVAWLAEHLEDDDPVVRSAAALFFREIGRADPGRMEEHTERVRTVLDAYELDDRASIGLIVALGRLAAGSEEEVDFQDIGRIGRFLERSSDWQIRSAAAQAITEWRTTPGGVEPIWPHLVGALSDSSDHVRLPTAGVLAEIAKEDSARATALREWVDENSAPWHLVSRLAQGIGRWEADWVYGWAADQMEDPDPLRRMAAIEGIREAFTPEVTDLLLDHATRELGPREVRSLMDVLSYRWPLDERTPGLHERYFAAFLNGLNTTDLPGFETAAYRLGSVEVFRAMGGPDSLEARFHALVENPELRQAVVNQMAGGDHPDAVDIFQEAMASSDPALRWAGAEAMRNHGRDPDPVARPSRAPPPLDWDYLATFGPDPRIEFETAHGSFVVQLDVEEAPLTAQTVLRFVEDGRYDATPFHRVVPGFVTQGGDFARGDGQGGPAFFIRTEATRIPFVSGTVGMASSGRDTEGSQFFVTHGDQPGLYARYSAFGRVVEGMDVVEAIQLRDELISARVLSRTAAPAGS